MKDLEILADKIYAVLRPPVTKDKLDEAYSL